MPSPHIELIEKLNTAARTAEDIYEEDRRRVMNIKAHIFDVQKELREAERIARKSGKQFNELNSKVWRLAKKQGITSIQYNPQERTSRAIFE